MLYQGEEGLEPSWEGMMSLTIFLAICVLGLDFMIFLLFQWTYGDKRRVLARQLAVHKNAFQQQAPRPDLVAYKKTSLNYKSRRHEGKVGNREDRHSAHFLSNSA